MAEEVVGSIASAVTAVVADRAVSKFLDSFNRQAAADEKLQRLERLLLRIHSTVEVSEKHAIESAALLRWQEKLRDAASHGDEVLLSFQQRATHADEAAAHQNGNDQQAGSSSTTTPGASTTALSFTRNALSSTARRIRSAATALFASNEDTKELDSAVEVLEKASENIGEFIGLLRLEASPNLKRRRAIPAVFRMQVGARAECGSPDRADRRQIEEPVAIGLGRQSGYSPVSPGSSLGWSNGGSAPVNMQYFLPPANELLIKEDISRLAETADDQELQELRALGRRLQEALAKISMAVPIVEARDIEDLEWLAQWTDVLREARKQGRIVLTTIRAKARKETVEYDLEDDELRSFVHTMESLAGELEFFNRLASLC